MKIGVAKKCINPTGFSVHLSGFANPKRQYTGVWNDTWVRAMVLQDDNTTLALVGCDLLHVNSTRLQAIGPKILKKTGIPLDNILFNACHTHSMPAVAENNRILDDYDAEYIDFLYEQVVSALCEAYENLEEGALEYAFAPFPGYAINRRRIVDGKCEFYPNPDGIIRENALILRAVCNGQTKGILTKFTCHASTIGENTAHGDWPGYACNCMEEQNPGAVALYMQGCCGDLRPCVVENPDDLYHTDFREGRYEDVANMGSAFARLAQKTMAGEMTPVTGGLSVKKLHFMLPLQPQPPMSAYDDVPGENYQLTIFKAFMRKNYDTYPTESPSSLQRIDLGDKLTIIGIEGEPVVEYEYHMDRIFPDRDVVTLGYSNGAMNYIPVERMFAEGGYESLESAPYYFTLPWDTSVERRIVGMAEKLK